MFSRTCAMHNPYQNLQIAAGRMISEFERQQQLLSHFIDGAATRLRNFGGFPAESIWFHPPTPRDPLTGRFIPQTEPPKQCALFMDAAERRNDGSYEVAMCFGINAGNGGDLVICRPIVAKVDDEIVRVKVGKQDQIEIETNDLPEEVRRSADGLEAVLLGDLAQFIKAWQNGETGENEMGFQASMKKDRKAA
jgi:hypothetical protein